MSLTLTRGTLQLDAAVGTAFTQAVCKATVQVPDEKPAIGRILTAKADVKLDSSSIAVNNGKVIVSGRLVLDVAYISSYRADNYVSDKEPINFLLSDAPGFAAELEVPDATEGMIAAIDAEVDSLEVDTAGDKIITSTAIIKVAAKVVQPTSLDLVTDIVDYDADKIKVDKKTLFIESKLGESINRVTIRDAFQVPEGKADIAEIVDYSAVVYVNSDGLRPSANRVNAAGTLDLRIAYTGDIEERPLEFLAGPQIDFQTAIDIPGAVDGTKVKGKGFLESLLISKIGSRTIQVEAVAGVAASVSAVCEASLVTDIQGIGEELVDVMKSNIRIESLVGQVSNLATISETFAVGSGMSDINEILMTAAKARITDAKVSPDKVTLVGEVDAYVTYAGIAPEDSLISPIETISQLGIPFELSLDVPGVEAGMVTFATGDVIEADAIKAGPRTIDIEVKVDTSIKVTEELDINVVTDAAVVPAETDTQSRRITIYVVQHGDSMWSVARRYDKTMSRIAEANKIASEQLYPGQKLLIPR